MLNQLTFANSLAVLTAALLHSVCHDRRCVASRILAFPQRPILRC